MRISTNQIYQQGIASLISQQEKATKLQQQLSTGLRVQSPSDDPIAAAQIDMITNRMGATELLQKNRQSAASALSLEEGAIASTVTSLQRLREIQIQAGNSSLSDDARKALSVEVKALLHQLQDLANSKDALGNYIFSGGKSSSPAVSLNSAGQYMYNGDSTQRFQSVTGSLQVPINDTGDNLFMRIPNGNGRFAINQTATPNTGTAVASQGSVVNSGAYVADNYTMTFAQNTAGQLVVMVTGQASGNVMPASGLVDDAPLYKDGESISFNGLELSISGTPAVGDAFAITSSINESVFSTVQGMIANLNQPFETAAQKALIQTENNQLICQLDSALNNMINAQSDLGARLNQLEIANTFNMDTLLVSSEALKQLREIDPVQVAVEYNLQIVNLQAAQQSFVRIQGLSVFNYL